MTETARFTLLSEFQIGIVDPRWRQSIYYPFAHASRYRRGVNLDLNLQSPVYEEREYGAMLYLDAVAVRDQTGEDLTVFAVNRGLESALPIEGDARAFAGNRLVEHNTLTHPDLKAVNSADNPDSDAPRANGDAYLDAGILRASLTKASWNVMRMARTKP